ncbi:hypothetical protein [Amycolatopsis sp. NPDC051371]|uniref:hypothetical protein n=1 Tax=Amycolatopsis sp. NPDC051371 TaxID=3155800 RepID=UPI0034151694
MDALTDFSGVVEIAGVGVDGDGFLPASDRFAGAAEVVQACGEDIQRFRESLVAVVGCAPADGDRVTAAALRWFRLLRHVCVVGGRV